LSQRRPSFRKHLLWMIVAFDRSFRWVGRKDMQLQSRAEEGVSAVPQTHDRVDHKIARS
jgi:hypothetical protein